MGSDLCRGVSPPGTAPEEHRSGAPSRPPYPLWPFGPSPPDRGSRPRTPVYGGYPLGWQRISGAQNLSDTLNSRRATGPWLCEKFQMVRFHCCACRLRTNVPGPFSTVGAHSVRLRAAEVVGPYGIPRAVFCMFRRGECPHPPAAFPFRGRCRAQRGGWVRRGGTPGPPQAFYKADRGAVFPQFIPGLWKVSGELRSTARCSPARRSSPPGCPRCRG